MINLQFSAQIMHELAYTCIQFSAQIMHELAYTWNFAIHFLKVPVGHLEAVPVHPAHVLQHEPAEGAGHPGRGAGCGG